MMPGVRDGFLGLSRIAGVESPPGVVKKERDPTVVDGSGCQQPGVRFRTGMGPGLIELVEHAPQLIELLADLRDSQ